MAQTDTRTGRGEAHGLEAVEIRAFAALLEEVD